MDWISNDKFLLRVGFDLENFSQSLEPDFYLTVNGKKFASLQNAEDGSVVHVVPRVLGGKGGFGSMLRAIGAQIEKTTNREACRDLSGRRLRDINEEKRLKNWINNKAELEKEQKDKRRKKLEKMVQEPKIEFKDSNYEEARSEMTEKVADALEHGLKAAAGSSGMKRPLKPELKVKNKKKKLWGMDEDEFDGSDSDSDECCDRLGDECSSTETSPGLISSSSDKRIAKISAAEGEKMDATASVPTAGGSSKESTGLRPSSDNNQDSNISAAEGEKMDATASVPAAGGSDECNSMGSSGLRPSSEDNQNSNNCAAEGEKMDTTACVPTAGGASKSEIAG